MKTYSNSPPGYLKLIFMAVAGFMLTALVVSNNALATTAFNAVISNTATVNYDDSAGNPLGPVVATADVTVNLVEATVTLSVPTPSAAESTFSGVAVDYTYTVTSNANGVDTYDLTSNQTATTGTITGNVRIFRNAADTLTITTIDLGASSVTTGVTVLAAGSTAVTVPADGTSDASVNGIEVNDTVIVNGAAHNVSAITDNASGTSTITLDGNGANNVLTAGMQIGEQAQFIFRVTPSATVDASTVTNEVSVRDDTPAQPAATHSTVTTVNLVPNITVTKYVRNNGPCAGGGCNPGAGGTTINGTTYWLTADGVTAEPGDTLEYVIAIQNALNAGQATDVIITDPIPAFTTYVGSSMEYDNAATVAGSGGWTGVTDAEDDSDKGEYDPTGGSETVYIYAGAAGTGDDGGVAATYGDGTGGNLNGNSFTFGKFQVQVQ